TRELKTFARGDRRNSRTVDGKFCRDGRARRKSNCAARRRRRTRRRRAQRRRAQRRRTNGPRTPAVHAKIPSIGPKYMVSSSPRTKSGTPKACPQAIQESLVERMFFPAADEGRPPL